jgi:hypothetical protein
LSADTRYSYLSFVIGEPVFEEVKVCKYGALRGYSGSLYISDLLGQRIAVVASGYYSKGSYSVVVNNTEMPQGIIVYIAVPIG